MLTAEQLMATNKANVETFFGLTAKAFEGVEKLAELNLAATRALLAETANQTQSVMGVKDAQELMTLQSNIMQPMSEKAASYSREVYDIATSTGAEFSKAVEAQFAQIQQKFMDVVESTAQNAPAGSETAIAVMKSAVTAANNVLESAQKSAKQAAVLAESNFKAATASGVESVKTASKKR